MHGLSAVDAAGLLFWVALPVIALGPPKWALCIWVLSTNLDGSGHHFEAGSSVGLINVIKGILIPLLLLWRLRRLPSITLNTWAGRSWLLFTSYAAVATLWSPFPLSAAKIVGYLVGILLAFIIFEKAARLGLIDSRFILVAIIGSLTAALVQTLFFKEYSYEPFTSAVRLTSFVSAQQFGALLVAFLAISLWFPHFSPSARIAVSAAILLACYLNGSRTWFIGALIVITIFAYLHARRAILYLVAITLLLAVLGLSVEYLGVSDSNMMSTLRQNRISATLHAVLGDDDKATQLGLGTLGFRVAMSRYTMRELRDADWKALLFGHGSASGGDLAIKYWRGVNLRYLDNNRVFHNEWFRILYEWGIFGFMIWLATLTSFVCALAVVRRRYPRVNVQPSLAYFPAFLLALASENILAGAGNAVTIGFAVLLGLMWINPTTEDLSSTWRWSTYGSRF
ncbi:MAG: O-antigen ligase family protein [Bryobacteraceae bacterium]|nr:O-antigen ligase family protein [Bryobacteraceae bacterium]